MGTKTVLIVEDNNVNRKILNRILSQDGYTILEAGNGREALSILSDGNIPINLVLLDIGMPVMDGHELLKIMNENGMIATIPVIVLTGSNNEQTEIQCLQEGASDFLKKPYNPQLVRHRVTSLMRLWDNAMLVNQLETDLLTGVYNKDCFMRHAQACLAENPDIKYNLLYTNIEDFKLINAHYGTQMGDKMLCYWSHQLVKSQGKDAIIGRIGSDVFAVLTKKYTLESQENVGESYTEMMKDAPIKGVSIKCGVFSITDPLMPISVIIDRAKLAQESIKQKYGYYYAIYDDSMSIDAMRDHQLSNYMEEALEQHQFLVYLQPKHSTENGAIAGAEALVRWIHPELGFISPGEFIPLFERNGFITKLDFFVWNEVVKALHRWIDAGLDPVPISVNASRADFLSPDLPEKIADLLDDYDIPPELVHVEVTESAYTNNPQQIIEAVSVLRDMGFKIEMDDFGSGYSSLNMLSELPIDILKLDMRFMQSGNDRLKGSKRNILSFIVSLSKWLQLPTVAEGVETDEEFEVLKSMGVDLIQGYFFAKPMPMDEFEVYMNAKSQSTDTNKTDVLPGASTLTPTLAEEEKPKILVVEDIETNRDVMTALLSSDYSIATAENGAIGYDYIKAHHQEISCILLDLLMPVMDGFQLLELLHDDDTLVDLPVIITTETGSNGELRALNLGAHSFVSKPYNPDVLRHHVRKAVEERDFIRYRRAIERENRILTEKAYRDELTGFLNRFGLQEAVKQLPETSAHAVILVDIDDLKSANDTYGHIRGGDALIAMVAKVIENYTREGDVLARIGGDEFIIILRKMKKPSAVLKKIQELCQSISEAKIPGTKIKPSCSAGIAMMCEEVSYDEAFERADEVLYDAKRNKKGTCCIWKEA